MHCGEGPSVLRVNRTAYVTEKNDRVIGRRGGRLFCVRGFGIEGIRESLLVGISTTFLWQTISSEFAATIAGTAPVRTVSTGRVINTGGDYNHFRGATMDNTRQLLDSILSSLEDQGQDSHHVFFRFIGRVGARCHPGYSSIPNQRTRMMSCTQLVSHVLPPSGEYACSQ